VPIVVDFTPSFLAIFFDTVADAFAEQGPLQASVTLMPFEALAVVATTDVDAGAGGRWRWWRWWRWWWCWRRWGLGLRDRCDGPPGDSTGPGADTAGGRAGRGIRDHSTAGFELEGLHGSHDGQLGTCRVHDAAPEVGHPGLELGYRCAPVGGHTEGGPVLVGVEGQLVGAEDRSHARIGADLDTGDSAPVVHHGLELRQHPVRGGSGRCPREGRAVVGRRSVVEDGDRVGRRGGTEDVGVVLAQQHRRVGVAVRHLEVGVQDRTGQRLAHRDRELELPVVTLGHAPEVAAGAGAVVPVGVGAVHVAPARTVGLWCRTAGAVIGALDLTVRVPAHPEGR
jgi:hypothetical protein